MQETDLLLIKKLILLGKRQKLHRLKVGDVEIEFLPQPLSLKRSNQKVFSNLVNPKQRDETDESDLFWSAGGP